MSMNIPNGVRLKIKWSLARLIFKRRVISADSGVDHRIVVG